MKHKLIGLYELITGIFGVLLLMFKIRDIIEHRQLIFTWFLGVVMFAGLAFAGYALLNKYKNAVKYSIWAQALQIISFTYGSARYLFTGAAFLGVIFGDGLRLQTQLQPIDYSISGNIANSPLEITIFILPVILVVLLAKR